MDFSKIDDLALLDLCRSHPLQQTALTELVQRFGPLIMQTVRWVFRRYTGSGDSTEVQDAFQEVFLLLLKEQQRRLRLFDPSRASITTYLVTVARNAAIDCLKRRGCHDRHARFETVELPFDDELADRAGQRRIVNQCLEQLSARERLFYHLYFEECMPPETIAQVMGIGTETVYSKKAKLIDKLRRLATEPISPKAREI